MQRHGRVSEAILCHTPISTQTHTQVISPCDLRKNAESMSNWPQERSVLRMSHCESQPLEHSKLPMALQSASCPHFSDTCFILTAE